jgi:hypothetical protein
VSPPTWIKPQLAALVKAAPNGPDWLHEIKLGGYRMYARLDAARVKIITRRGNDWTDKYPALAEAVASPPAQSAYLDGELCGVLRGWPDSVQPDPERDRYRRRIVGLFCSTCSPADNSGDLVGNVPWIIPSANSERPLANLTKPWFRIRRAAHFTDARLRDLRQRDSAERSSLIVSGRLALTQAKSEILLPLGRKSRRGVYRARLGSAWCRSDAGK